MADKPPAQLVAPHISAPGFPERSVRERARHGSICAFPPIDSYGSTLFGASPDTSTYDSVDALRLVPPIFSEHRMEKLVNLGREPLYSDVDLSTDIGSLRSAVPLYISAFGSTQVASGELGLSVARQAGSLGMPMVIGENVVPMNGGYGRLDVTTKSSLLMRLRAYTEEVPDGTGGVVVQQSTEDADFEVWNLLYSDPSAQHLLNTGRLGFELKVGQGAKPGLGGMTVMGETDAAAVSQDFLIEMLSGRGDRRLRCSSPGTFTAEVLAMQVRLMRNNFPRARTWVKLHPGRDVGVACEVAWSAGADAVTVDGAEAGTGWAPDTFLQHVGLSMGECLRRIDPSDNCLLVSGRIWEGTRVVKALALGARAVGLGRAALLAADEDPSSGLRRLVDCLSMEARMLISALGKYRVGDVDRDDVWSS